MIAQRVLIIHVLYHPPAKLLMLCSSELFIFSPTSLGFNKLHLTAYLLCVMLNEFEQYSEKLGGFPIHTLKQALLKRVSGNNEYYCPLFYYLCKKTTSCHKFSYDVPYRVMTCGSALVLSGLYDCVGQHWELEQMFQNMSCQDKVASSYWVNCKKAEKCSIGRRWGGWTC